MLRFYTNTLLSFIFSRFFTSSRSPSREPMLPFRRLMMFRCTPRPSMRAQHLHFCIIDLPFSSLIIPFRSCLCTVSIMNGLFRSSPASAAHRLHRAALYSYISKANATSSTSVVVSPVRHSSVSMRPLESHSLPTRGKGGETFAVDIPFKTLGVNTEMEAV